MTYIKCKVDVQTAGRWQSTEVACSRLITALKTLPVADARAVEQVKGLPGKWMSAAVIERVDRNRGDWLYFARLINRYNSKHCHTINCFDRVRKLAYFGSSLTRTHFLSCSLFLHTGSTYIFMITWGLFVQRCAYGPAPKKYFFFLRSQWMQLCTTYLQCVATSTKSDKELYFLIDSAHNILKLLWYTHHLCFFL